MLLSLQAHHKLEPLMLARESQRSYDNNPTVSLSGFSAKVYAQLVRLN
ncbi:hypothetical protein [Holzapfeliella floricola]|nr:hypothetical protein [Holzapfeliella floricola]